MSASRSVVGQRSPRISHVPPIDSDVEAKAAIGLGESAGLFLDPWQRDTLTSSMGRCAHGAWTAFEVCWLCSRQNGKNAPVEVRQLYGLFVEEEPVQIHTAHEFKAAKESFRRVKDLIVNNDWLIKRCKKPYESNSRVGIETLTGLRLEFLARSGNSGRSFTCDTLYLDEAFNLAADAVAAIVPTLATRPNPQVYYLSSPGDVTLAPCDQLASLRRRAMRALAAGQIEEGLVYLEWSIPYEDGEDGTSKFDKAAVKDLASYIVANPGLGHRLPVEMIERLSRTLELRRFAREFLGVGFWPPPVVDDLAVIDRNEWAARALRPKDPRVMRDPVVLAVDVAPEGAASSIASAGAWDHEPDRTLVDLIANRPGSAWVVDEVVRLLDKHDVVDVLLDPASQAGTLINDFKAKDVDLNLVTGREMGQACGDFLNKVKDGRLRHLGQADLDDQAKAAGRRTIGPKLWGWAPTDGTPISGLVAVTLASHGHALHGTIDYDLARSVG